MVNRKIYVPLRPFMRHLVHLLVLMCCLCLPSRLSAQDVQVADSIVVDSTLQVSLLTCSPGFASYELYGHTALRVHSTQYDYDVVFNYGVFDFKQEHFVWRFVLGECDYMCAASEYYIFEHDYRMRGSSITEQVLNLLPIEASELTSALLANCQPENSVYRYNIFRSNCTTKARDMIEAYVRGVVRYPARAPRYTFRQILHQFTADSPWDEAGNDLLLGADVDTLLCERDEMFAPIYMMWYADSAMIDRGAWGCTPLVRERRVLLEENSDLLQQSEAAEPTFFLTPAQLFWGLLCATLLLGYWEVRRRRVVWGVDAVLMTLQGIAGILIVFMSLFSEHPAVDSNWQAWLLNPLPLFFVYPVVRADIRGERSVYHAGAAAVLVAFLLLSYVIPQHFSSITMPLALLLLSRTVVHLWIYRLSR